MNRLLLQQDFKALFDSTLDAIMVADDDGVYVAVNAAACQLLKAPESAIIGRTVADFLPPEQHAKAKANWQVFLQQGQRAGEIELLCADGSKCVVEFKAKANFLPGQHLSVLRDITDRKQAEAALRESNRQIVSIMESVSDTVLAFDRDWRFLYANPQSEAILGRPPHEVLGKDLWQEYPATLGTVFEEGYRRAANEHVPVRFQGCNPETDKWLEVHVYPSDVGVTVYIRDISDRKRAQDDLLFLSEAGAVLSSSLEHDQIIENVAHLTLSYLADWCAIDVLEEGQLKRLALAHKDPNKIEFAHEFHRLYPPNLASDRGVAQVLRTGEPQLWAEISDELLAATAPDSRWLEMIRSLGMQSIMLVPLVAGGRTIGVMTLVREKSGQPYSQSDLIVAQELGRRAGGAVENGRLFHARTQALRTAEEANQAKDEFLAVVSHELKTPMTPILGWIGLLKERVHQPDPELFGHALDVMERNVKVQAQLVNDLLDISRIVTGKVHLNLSLVNPGTLAQLVVETMRGAAQDKGIDLILDLSDELVPILADERRLQQVLWNLLSNAIKFTPSDGLVVLSLKQSESFIEFKVRDTGQGLPPDFLPYVFDRFRQADSSSSREHGGLGLGLSIARHLVELHGGTIHVDSAGLGLGCTFSVRLPLRASQEEGVLPAPQSSIGEEASRHGEDGQKVAQELLDGLHILIIEDMEDSREMVVAILKQNGAQVREASSAREGLQAIQQDLPDVIVCDIGMPGENGYWLIEQVRALPRDAGGAIPAIALTAYGRAEDRLKALSSGFDNHLVKPAVSGDLVRAISSLKR